MNDTFIVGNYLVLAVFVGFLGYKRRISFVILWPYLLYGFGLTVPVFFGDSPDYHFAHVYYNDESLSTASLLLAATVTMIAALDLIIFRRKTLRSLLENGTNLDTIAAIVESPLFTALFTGTGAVFAVIYALAWAEGDIGKEYVFRGLEQLRYWGPLGVATESVCALGVLYVFAQIAVRGRIRRRPLIEVLLLSCLIARAVPGTRIPFVKVALVSAIFTFLLFRIRFRHVAITTGATTAAYLTAAWLGYQRLGNEFSFTPDHLLFPLNGEAFFVNLSLVLSTRNIEMQFYQPGLPIGILLFLLPSWSSDKFGLVRQFFDRDLFAHAIGLPSVSPVGGTNFIADVLIAYGPYFLIPLIIVILGAFYFFRGQWTPKHVLIFIAFMSISHNLWRDSFFIAVKGLIENYALPYGILWVFVGKDVYRQKLLTAGQADSGQRNFGFSP